MPDVSAPECGACSTVAAVVRLSGLEVRCDCGTIYAPRWDGSEGAEDAPDPGRLIHRVPQRDSTGGMPSGGLVVARRALPSLGTASHPSAPLRGRCWGSSRVGVASSRRGGAA